MSATTVVKRLPKPDWNNIHRRQTYRHIYISLATSFGTATAAYFMWYVPKWEAIKEYERNYDPFSEMERMRNLGLFSSCPPDYIIEEKKQKALAKQAKKK